MEVAAAYRALLEQLDGWFARARERAGKVVPCRTGCTACCHGPFDISVADVLLLEDGLAALGEEERREVARAAAVQLARAAALEPAWRPPYEIAAIGEERFDRLSDALETEPCPLLDDSGRCRVYASRPLVCRIMGLAMRTPAGRTIENACPIAEQFPGYAALAPSPFELERFEEAEATALADAAVELFGHAAYHDFETFIAAAVAGAR